VAIKKYEIPKKLHILCISGWKIKVLDRNQWRNIFEAVRA
jgi:hypothetical protein